MVRYPARRHRHPVDRAEAERSVLEALGIHLPAEPALYDMAGHLTAQSREDRCVRSLI
jgi:hypothetical protein